MHASVSRCHSLQHECLCLLSGWALQEFDIDTERLPLGQLSKEQVQRGYDVLERIRTALNSGGESLERLSSEFYQVSTTASPWVLFFPNCSGRL